MSEPAKMRLWNLLKRFFVKSQPTWQPPSSPPVSADDKREYDRHAMSFPVIVSGTDINGRSFQEKTVLRDVSGSGALFLSKFSGRYASGQQLKLAVILDVASDVRARITTEATVVRIDPFLAGSADPSGASEGIAVQFHRSFDFERVDHDTDGLDR